MSSTADIPNPVPPQLPFFPNSPLLSYVDLLDEGAGGRPSKCFGTERNWEKG